MAVQTLQPASEYESVNPFDGKTVKTFVPTTDEQLEAKIVTAQRAMRRGAIRRTPSAQSS
jgi:acyl-CoA reductase-like NAD-dependent aldehyde dehydrogenase